MFKITKTILTNQILTSLKRGSADQHVTSNFLREYFIGYLGKMVASKGSMFTPDEASRYINSSH